MLNRNERARGQTGPGYYSIWNKALFADGAMHVMMTDDGKTLATRSTFAGYTPHNTAMMGCPTLMNYSGKIWICASEGVDFTWTGTLLEIASSTDGDNWTYVASPNFSSIAIGGFNQVWADTWFQDDDGSLPYLSIEANNNADGSTNKVYLTQALNSSLTSFSSPVQITGSGFPASMQNIVCTKYNGTYYLFYKNQSNRNIEVATNSTFGASGWTVVKTGDWAGWSSVGGQPTQNREAPVLLRIGTRYRMYLDMEGNGIVMSESLTNDPIGSWTAPVAVTAPFGTPQHGSVIVNPTGH